MIGAIFELLDFFILLKDISPLKKYKNENIYWRITGIPLLTITILIWFLIDYIGSTSCIVISLVSGIWLFSNLYIRDVLIEKNKKEEAISKKMKD